MRTGLLNSKCTAQRIGTVIITSIIITSVIITSSSTGRAESVLVRVGRKWEGGQKHCLRFYDDNIPSEYFSTFTQVTGFFQHLLCW